MQGRATGAQTPNNDGKGRTGGAKEKWAHEGLYDTVWAPRNSECMSWANMHNARQHGPKMQYRTEAQWQWQTAQCCGGDLVPPMHGQIHNVAWQHMDVVPRSCLAEGSIDVMTFVGMGVEITLWGQGGRSACTEGLGA